MAEVAPVAAAATVKTAAKKAAPKARKASGPSVTELLTKAVTASKERGGVSLAALKKSLVAAGYDVEKNNSRIKLGLKSLVARGILLQTKGTGASGSFKLNKKQADNKDKAPKKPVPAKTKKPAAAKVKKAVGAAGAKKSVKKVAKKAAGSAKKAAKSPKKSKVTKPKKTTKSPAKPLKPKAKAKPKASKPAPKKK